MLLLLASGTYSHAGGTSVPVDILDIHELGKDRYILRLKTLDTVEYDVADLPRNAVLTIRLRYDRLRYLAKGDLLSVSKYREAIALLRVQKDATSVRFGLMGGGLCKVPGEPNTYDSDALDIFQEDHSHTKQTFTVVYSYCEWS